MFCVYHVEEYFDELRPKCELFEDLTKALERSNSLRNMNCRFVTVVGEVDGNVTKMGGDIKNV